MDIGALRIWAKKRGAAATLWHQPADGSAQVARWLFGASLDR
jgi:hypothetical protein